MRTEELVRLTGMKTNRVRISIATQSPSKHQSLLKRDLAKAQRKARPASLLRQRFLNPPIFQCFW